MMFDQKILREKPVPPRGLYETLCLDLSTYPAHARRIFGMLGDAIWLPVFLAVLFFRPSQNSGDIEPMGIIGTGFYMPHPAVGNNVMIFLGAVILGHVYVGYNGVINRNVVVRNVVVRKDVVRKDVVRKDVPTDSIAVGILADVLPPEKTAVDG